MGELRAFSYLDLRPRDPCLERSDVHDDVYFISAIIQSSFDFVELGFSHIVSHWESRDSDQQNLFIADFAPCSLYPKRRHTNTKKLVLASFLNQLVDIADFQCRTEVGVLDVL